VRCRDGYTTERESDQCRKQVTGISEVATEDDRCGEPEQERPDGGATHASAG
jgi:hypothetical protein